MSLSSKSAAAADFYTLEAYAQENCAVGLQKETYTLEKRTRDINTDDGDF